MFDFLKKIFKDPNEKELEKLQIVVDDINQLESKLQKLNDSELKAKTPEFKERYNKGESLDDLLPEAFAVVREASQRSTEEEFRHFDVQLMGGIALHEGKIAEMKTGEGKTLVATLPVYLNALTGKGVHVVTVNDYLAKRDSEWMGQIYKFLGMEVGVVLSGMTPEERKKAYDADVTYGTNNEFGFDYLRANMATDPDNVIEHDFHFAILDEVDSILIDEARTPLIISGPVQETSQDYRKFNRIIPKLEEDKHYELDEKNNNVTLTEEGVHKVEDQLGIDNLFDEENFRLHHQVNQALRAHTLMKKDRDYIVDDGKVKIVDEFTGRVMEGRRYSEGLHQAIEAKERVSVQKGSQTFARITLQNYFRMYDKLAGMTGTAKTEEEEFIKIYGMEVIVIPTNEPLIRDNKPDLVFKDEESKFRAVVKEIEERNEKGQPFLVGTVDIDKSEKLSRMLNRKGIQHNVLNAKNHKKEAEIIKDAGQKNSVTIATNMAGRGTDIVLGEGVVELGGLHVLGTERHESRRIDNQLRGRSGRQGDPGSSVFYVSMEDKIMRLFGGDNMKGMMDRMGMDDSMPINHPLLSKSIESAQKKVENRNFDIRKHVLEYDNVMNQQREVIYRQRREVLMQENLREKILGMIEDLVDDSLARFNRQSEFVEEWDLDGLLAFAHQTYLPAMVPEPGTLRALSPEEVRETFVELAHRLYDVREETLGEETMRQLERIVLLKVVDQKWMDHIDAMDNLKSGIGLRAYGQKDPLVEYKFEGFDMFENMIYAIKEDV